MVVPSGGYSGQQVRTFVAAAAEPNQSQTDFAGQERGFKVAECVPRMEVDISRKVDVARSLAQAAPFQEVGDANKGAASLIALLVTRETSNHPLRLIFGLLFGFFAGTVCHWMFGVFDVLCVLSTILGSLGYFLVVGGSFTPAVYFVTAPIFLNFGLPVIEKKMGWEDVSTSAGRGGAAGFTGRARNNAQWR